MAGRARKDRPLPATDAALPDTVISHAIRIATSNTAAALPRDVRVHTGYVSANREAHALLRQAPFSSNPYQRSGLPRPSRVCSEPGFDCVPQGEVGYRGNGLRDGEVLAQQCATVPSWGSMSPLPVNADHHSMSRVLSLESEIFGKRLLVTYHDNWTVPEVIARYRSPNDVESGFRQLKDLTSSGSPDDPDRVQDRRPRPQLSPRPWRSPTSGPTGRSSNDVVLCLPDSARLPRFVNKVDGSRGVGGARTRATP